MRLSVFAACTVVCVFACPSVQANQDEWFDNARHVAQEKVDAVALWFDGYFGDPQADPDALAHNYMRVIGRTLWYAESATQTSVRIRGSLHLPRFNERLELLFEDDQPDESDPKALLGEGFNETQVALRWHWIDNDAWKLDLTAHWKNSGVRPGVRFRRSVVLSRSVALRGYHRFDYNSEGWDTVTDIAIDRTLTNSSSLRWRNRIDTSLGREEARWRSVLQLRSIQGDGVGEIGRRWSVGLAGLGSPSLTDATKTVSFTWRRSFWRDYLWFEVEPRYIWNSEACECNTAGIQLKAEVLLFDPD